jgi:hypothetical protein
MPTYTSPFTGTVVTPTDVSYYALSFSSNTQLYWPVVVNPTQVPAARIMDCVASTNGLSIFLPDASQGAVGTDILFRNLGAFPFVIKDAAGNESITVGVGKAEYLYLTDNTSLGGSWGSVGFGVGTSYADAAALQGAGLTTVSGKLATTQNLIDFSSSNPVINDASRASTFVWTDGAGSMTLPAVGSLSTGWYIGFRNNGTGTLTINPTSPDLINGLVTITANPGDSGFIFYDNNTAGFVTVGLAAPANVTFTAATYDVDAISGTSLSLVSYAPIIQTYVAQSGTRTTTLNVTLPAITQIYILVNNTNQTGYNITFQNQGSSQPPLVLPAGAVATVLSDGTNLYPLTTSSTGIFYAVNGSAALPSFSFNNDTHTGMYLDGTSILGLSANSTELLRIDNSNTLQPLITANATFNAQLIGGGTF